MQSAFRYFLTAVLLASGWSCQEHLPPYVSPANLFEGEVSVQIDPLVQYSHVDYNNIYQPAARVRITSAPTTVTVNVRNKFDETIQDVEGIAGSVEIWVADRPELRTTIPVDASASSSPFYDPSTRIITLDAEQTFQLKVYWSFRFDDGSWVFTRLGIASEGRPPGGQYQRRHTPTEFRARATVQLFSHLAPARSTVQPFTVTMEGTVTAPP